MNAKIVLIAAIWLLNGFILGCVVVGTAIAYYMPGALQGMWSGSFWDHLPLLCIILLFGIYFSFAKTRQLMRDDEQKLIAANEK